LQVRKRVRPAGISYRLSECADRAREYISVRKSPADFREAGVVETVKTRPPSCLRGRLQSPELKTRKLDGLFDLRSGKSVWGMLIGLDRTRRSPRSMALRQFAPRWIAGKCVQVRSCFRSEHIDEHNDAFRNAVLIERRATTRIAK